MPWRNRIGRARAGAPDVTRSTSRPAISIGIPRDSSRPAGRGQAARIASRSRPGAARRLGPDEEDDREDVQERRERPREVVASGRVIDRARDERTPAGHRAGQREEESDDRARLAAAEEVADDRGEERGDRAVRVPEDERVAEEQGEAAAGEEEAEEADGLERHRDPDGRLAPDPVRDRAHDETARDGVGPLTRAIRTPAFWMLGATFTATWIPVFIPLVHLIPFTRDLGHSALTGAWVVSTVGIGAVAGRLVMGAVSDRIGRKPAVGVAMALQAVGFLGFLLAGRGLPL